MMTKLSVGLLSGAMAAQAIPAPDPAVEWLKFGLLGAVLAWIFFFHLPAKDKQLKDHLDASAAERKDAAKAADERDVKERDEREKERKARHDMANTLQATVNTLTVEHQKQMLAMAEQHRSEAERDRSAFMLRQSEQSKAVDGLKSAMDAQTAAIMAQTQTLVAAIKEGACRSTDSPRRA